MVGVGYVWWVGELMDIHVDDIHIDDIHIDDIHIDSDSDYHRFMKVLEYLLL